MKPIIIDFDCADHDPIDEWVPSDPFDVDFWMNFTFGYDQTGGDNFQVHIVSHKNLRGPNPEKYAIIIHEYSWQAVLESVNEILQKCQGKDWDEVSKKLSMFMYWEFENYRTT